MFRTLGCMLILPLTTQSITATWPTATVMRNDELGFWSWPMGAIDGEGINQRIVGKADPRQRKRSAPSSSQFLDDYVHNLFEEADIALFRRTRQLNVFACKDMNPHCCVRNLASR